MRFLFALFLLLVSAQASAIFIDNNSFTTDTDTGLDWLDVNLSVGRPLTDLYGLDGSINDFTDTSGDFFEWRYAIESEVVEFFINAGLNPPVPGQNSQVTTIVNDPIIEEFLDLTGRTFIGQGNAFNCSMYDDEGFGLQDFSGIACAEEYYNTEISPSRLVIAVDGNEIYNINSGQGNWLVRSTTMSVPEPATLALMSLGLVGISFSRRKKAA